MEVLMIRYPHGWNRGGVWENEFAPAMTTSGWELNNLLIEIHDDESDNSVRRLQRDDPYWLEFCRNGTADLGSQRPKERLETD